MDINTAIQQQLYPHQTTPKEAFLCFVVVAVLFIALYVVAKIKDLREE